MEPVEERCVNGCDAPICPPSKVVCRACLDRMTATLEATLKRMEERDAGIS